MRALQTSSIVDQMLSVQSFQLHICLAASKHDRRRCRSAHILVQDRLDGWSSDCMFCMFEPIYYKLCADISNAYHMFWLNPVLYGDNHLFSDVFFSPCSLWFLGRKQTWGEPFSTQSFSSGAFRADGKLRHVRFGCYPSAVLPENKHVTHEGNGHNVHFETDARF